MSPRVISFHYTLTDPQGKLLDSSKGHEPFSYLEDAGQIIPGLEKLLRNFKADQKGKVMVPAAEAYGLRNPKFIIAVPRAKFGDQEVKVGDEFQESDDPNSHPFRVTEVNTTHVTLDANHPLAGVDLTFDVEVVAAREATPQEIQHGHTHGADSH